MSCSGRCPLNGNFMADEDDDQDQDETPEPPQRLFTLTEAENTRQELEPFLVEAMNSRKKLSGRRLTVFSKPDVLSRTSTSAFSISLPSSISRTSISAGSSARTASAFTIARTKDSTAANRSIRTTWAPATPFSNFYVVTGLQTGAFFPVSF